MKVSDLRGMTEAELKKQLDDLYETLYKFRFNMASGQLPDTNKLKQVRHDIARVKTLLRELDLAAERGKVGA